MEEEGKSIPKLDVQLVNLLLINLEKVMHKLQLKVEKGDEEKEKLEFMDFDSLEMKIVILERLEIRNRVQSRKKSQKRVIVSKSLNRSFNLIHF